MLLTIFLTSLAPNGRFVKKVGPLDPAAKRVFITYYYVDSGNTVAEVGRFEAQIEDLTIALS